MQDPKIWELLSKHLAGEESKEDTELFLNWLNESEDNKAYFYKVKELWEQSGSVHKAAFTGQTPSAFRQKITFSTIKDFILKQAMGNLVGFIVGMWVVSTFSHTVLEKKSFKNLFGLAGRKRIVVNEIPEWLQDTLAILIGFIVLELINYFFQTKKHLLLWTYIRRAVKNNFQR